MSILLLGSQGQLGGELARSFQYLGDVVTLDQQELDLTDKEKIRFAVRTHTPELIINAAAYTAVDKAESDLEAAMAVNALAPGILAEEAARLGALLIHYSTDYVFDGKSERPYKETDATWPLNTYGRSKLAGEQAIAASGVDYLILRTSWVYGLRGQNFLQTILRLAAECSELKVVADQFGAPSWARWIADSTAHIASLGQQRRLAKTFLSGIYHLTCSGSTSWHGFAKEIIARYQNLQPDVTLAVRNIQAIPATEYPMPALRPSNSRLDCSRVIADYGVVCPDWREALQLCLNELPVAK
jgi:dTDP-4-dehydrorhamnose reductase